MAKGVRAAADAIYVAHNFQELYAPERMVFALHFITTEGKQIIIELPGQGAKHLRDKMQEAFEQHPEMERWGVKSAGRQN